MKTIELGGNTFEYDEGGSGKSLIMVSGWCQDHRLYKNLVGPLRERFHVIRFNWRGHDADRRYNGDFTTADMVNDVVAFLDAKGIDQVHPISASHGGWANIDIADKLGVSRVPKVVVFDWLMLSKFTDLMTALRVSQDPATWSEGRDSLFNEWVHNTDNQDTIRHVWDEMASFDQEMWSRSCREIEVAYNQWNSPLERLAALSPSRPVAHIYSQPISPDYDQLQRDFAKEHPWFKPCKIEGKTHFPALESAPAAAKIIADFIG